MSAVRRREVIECFSVPIEGASMLSSSQTRSAESVSMSGRAVRRSRSSRKVLMDVIDVEEGDGDSDFVADEDDDADSFAEDDDIIEVKPKKGKGKAQAKIASQKSKIRSDLSSILGGGVNPKVSYQ
jgi:hypothetical protein